MKSGLVRPRRPLLSPLLSPARVSALLLRAPRTPGSRRCDLHGPGQHSAVGPCGHGTQDGAGTGLGHSPTARAKRSPRRSARSSCVQHLTDLEEGRVTPVHTAHLGHPGEHGRRYPDAQHTHAAFSSTSPMAPGHHLLLSRGAKDPTSRQGFMAMAKSPPPPQGGLCFLHQVTSVQGPLSQDPTPRRW